MPAPTYLLPATPYTFDDGVSIPRRGLSKGDEVTGEDPAAYGFGLRGRVIGLAEPEHSAPLRVIVAWGDTHQTTLARRDIRHVLDKPHSAQIGWARTVWDE